MACLCPMMSGIPSGKKWMAGGWLDGQGVESSGGCFPHVFGIWMGMAWWLDSARTLSWCFCLCLFHVAWAGRQHYDFHYTLKSSIVLSKIELPGDEKYFHKFHVPKSFRSSFKKWLLLSPHTIPVGVRLIVPLQQIVSSQFVKAECCRQGDQYSSDYQVCIRAVMYF